VRVPKIAPDPHPIEAQVGVIRFARKARPQPPNDGTGLTLCFDLAQKSLQFRFP
jgi:hypothetical protein